MLPTLSLGGGALALAVLVVPPSARAQTAVSGLTLRKPIQPKAYP